MNLAGFSIRRPVTTLMILLGIILIGFVSSSRIPFNLLPEITYPKVTIRTEYPHAAPEEVESLITKPIEQAVGIINNVVKVSSISKPGMSEVVVEFRWGVDMDVAVMDIRERLQLLEGFLPEEAKKPIILRYDPTQDPILTIGVAGKMDLSDLRYLVEQEVERELERIDGVAAVKLEGGFEDEIIIELDDTKLAQFGITPEQVIDRLRRENINLAGGTLTEAGEELAVRTLNEFETLEEIRNIIITTGEISTRMPTAISGIPTISSGLAGMFMGGISALAGMPALLPSTAPSSQAVKITVPVRLGDIARVKRRHKQRKEIVRLNGKECIKLSIYKEGDANIVQVANAVKETLKQVKNNLRAQPATREELKKLRSPGQKIKKAFNGVFRLFLNVQPFKLYQPKPKLINELEIEIISDQSRFIKQAIYSVVQSALWGALIAVLVLYFFLRNFPSTAIIGMAIPISIITTFNLMFFTGISFNTMSLGGLALGVGILVDNSIVVLENILRHRVKNPDLKSSAINASREVSGAITASTLTNIIVFFPILYVEGMFRQIFGDLAWTVTFSLIASELVALIIVPMLSVYMGRRVRLPKELADLDSELPTESAPIEKPAPRRRPRFSEFKSRLGWRAWFDYPFAFLVWLVAEAFQKIFDFFARVFKWVLYFPLKWFDRGFIFLKTRYPKLIDKVLQKPKTVFATSMLLVLLAFLGLYLTGWELLPDVDQGEFRIHFRLPVGTPITETDRKIRKVEEKISTLSEKFQIKNIFSTIGASVAGGELESEKSENLAETAVILTPRQERKFSDNELIQKLRKLLEREPSLKFSFSKPQLFSYKQPIVIEIVGYNLKDLRRASELVLGKLKTINGLADLESTIKEANPEIAIRVDRERASYFGLNASQIAEVLEKKIKGALATHFREAERQLDIIVQVEESQRKNLTDLENIQIPIGGGKSIPLKAVAEIKASKGPGTITRVSGSRVALITANLSGITLGTAVKEIQQALKTLNLPKGCFWRIAGQNEEMRRSLSSLYLAVFLAIFLVYIVLASQFESLLHPFVIMFGVFYSLVGLCIMLLLTRTTINVFSLIGTMMMLGISVNDAIVLITTINLRRQAGLERVDAIKSAASARLRPILITTLTTVLGMLPMALPFGEGYELRSPMAIAVIGGLLSSTFFTMCVIPAVYLVLDQMGERFWARIRGRV